MNDAERRLYELARRPMPLAEVAVRLGVATSEADRRIAALLAQLGLETRAALQRDYGPASARDASSTPLPLAQPGHRWRWVAFAVAAVAVLVIAGVLVWRSSRGTGQSEETQSSIQATPGPNSG